MLTKAAVSVVRPIYRGLVERPLWWFLGKVKAFFFAETVERLLAIEQRLAALEKGGANELIGHIEARNAAQWSATEQLLMAMFCQPQSRLPEPNREDGSLRHNGL